MRSPTRSRGAAVEAGVALLGADGRPWAWAGAHRLAPRGDGRPVATADNPFYLVLEVARDAPTGRRAVGTVVVWASPAVPERVRSVTEDFRARTGVGLRVYPAGTAPDLPSVFDYTEPTTAGPRLLFSVEPLPPALAEATAAVRAEGSRATAVMLLLTLALVVIVAGGVVARYATLLLGVAVLARAPVGPSLGLPLFFSPLAFFRPILGPLSRSAGALASLALVVTLLSVALWNRPPRRRWFSVPSRHRPAAGLTGRPALPGAWHHAPAAGRVPRPLARLGDDAGDGRDGAGRRGRRAPPGRTLQERESPSGLGRHRARRARRRRRPVRLAAGIRLGRLVHLPLAPRPAPGDATRPAGRDDRRHRGRRRKRRGAADLGHDGREPAGDGPAGRDAARTGRRSGRRPVARAGRRHPRRATGAA